MPIPKPSLLENLDDEEEQKIEEIKVESISNVENSTNDLKSIDELLKKTATYTINDSVNDIKSVVAKAKNKGINLEIQEMDFENTYQIIIKIEK